MSKKTVDDYKFYWSEDGVDLCVSPPLEDIDPALALPLSVKKWDVARKVDNPAIVRTNGAETCGLCAVYWGRGTSCAGCVVKEVTGLSLCQGTPYHHTVSLSGHDERGRVWFEAEYQFLLALQNGGVEAGREWLKEWSAKLVQDAEQEETKTVDDYTFFTVGNQLFVKPTLSRVNLTAELSLALSIKKWARMSEHSRLHGNGASTCGACHFYGSCTSGCIIYKTTGETACKGTPHELYYVMRAMRLDDISWIAKAEHQFLLILQDEGIEAGREWLARWWEKSGHDADVEARAG